MRARKPAYALLLLAFALRPVAGEVDTCHPAAADLALDLVSAGERGPQRVQLIRERCTRADALRGVRRATIP